MKRLALCFILCLSLTVAFAVLSVGTGESLTEASDGFVVDFDAYLGTVDIPFCLLQNYPNPFNLTIQVVWDGRKYAGQKMYTQNDLVHTIYYFSKIEKMTIILGKPERYDADRSHAYFCGVEDNMRKCIESGDSEIFNQNIRYNFV